VKLRIIKALEIGHKEETELLLNESTELMKILAKILIKAKNI